MNQLAIQNIPEKTISSIDLLAVINKTRLDEGRKYQMRHDNFLKKIESELGDHALKFKGMIVVQIGNGGTRESPCYHLPRREAEIMVMSESPRVRAAVYDRMRELESTVRETFTLNQEWVAMMLDRQQALAEKLDNNISVLGANFGELSGKVETVCDDIADIKGRITILETRRPRREIKQSTKADHIYCLDKLGWRCPLTHVPVTMAEIEFVHFFANSLPDFKHTWPLSKKGHAMLTHGKMSRVDARPAFEAYQSYAERTLPKQFGFFA